jgi:hypothetical protein
MKLEQEYAQGDLNVCARYSRFAGWTNKANVRQNADTRCIPE